MNDRDQKKWIESLCINKKFPFTYNGITNNNLNFGHDIKNFFQDRFIEVEFSIHSELKRT